MNAAHRFDYPAPATSGARIQTGAVTGHNGATAVAAVALRAMGLPYYGFSCAHATRLRAWAARNRPALELRPIAGRV